MASPTDELRGGERKHRVRRQRLAVLFAAILLTNVAALALALAASIGSEGDVDGFTYSAVQGDRSYFWTFLVLSGSNLVVGVTAIALAAVLLTPARGAVPATVGAAMCFLGAGFYAVGIGGWATAYYFATDLAVLKPATSMALFDQINTDFARTYGAAFGGAALVAVGTVLLSVGLWRAGTVPRWIPIVAAVSILLTFIVPPSGAPGPLVEGTLAVASIAIGWYAWRQAREINERNPA